MKRTRDELRTKREHTDASLGAERASADVSDTRNVARAQRISDDLIEHGRSLADERLTKLRAHADDAMLRERVASSPASAKRDADEEKKAERAVTDILLSRERERADMAVETLRRDTDAHHVRVAERRFDTNEKLSSERGDADLAVNELENTQNALASKATSAPRRADLLAIVTHDLRSPLSVIALNAQIIVETCETDATRDMACDIRLAAARMERLLTDLLDVARIESGSLRVVKRACDVNALLVDLQHSYAPLFAERGVTFTVVVPPISLVASFDYDRIVQVFSNLLSNAMKFTPKGGTIRLDVARCDDGAEFVLRDSGAGIAPDALEHVFEQFSQIDSDARRGLGLGLYICEKLVSAHGGRIGVESVLGRGTTIRFTLPLEEANAPA